MEEIIEQSENYRVKLVIEDAPEDPRKAHDHIVSVVTVPDRKYIVVDQDGGPLSDQWDRLMEKYEWSTAVDMFERWARIFQGAVTLLDTPNEGANAVWYITAEVALREGITDSMAALKAERDEYRAWAGGDVWGYVIERRVTWVRRDGDDTMETWEHEDSCWGYYGYEYAESCAREEFGRYVSAQDNKS